MEVLHGVVSHGGHRCFARRPRMFRTEATEYTEIYMKFEIKIFSVPSVPSVRKFPMRKKYHKPHQ